MGYYIHLPGVYTSRLEGISSAGFLKSFTFEDLLEFDRDWLEAAPLRVREIKTTFVLSTGPSWTAALEQADLLQRAISFSSMDFLKLPSLSIGYKRLDAPRSLEDIGLGELQMPPDAIKSLLQSMSGGIERRKGIYQRELLVNHRNNFELNCDNFPEIFRIFCALKKNKIKSQCYLLSIFDIISEKPNKMSNYVDKILVCTVFIETYFGTNPENNLKKEIILKIQSLKIKNLFDDDVIDVISRSYKIRSSAIHGQKIKNTIEEIQKIYENIISLIVKIAQSELLGEPDDK